MFEMKSRVYNDSELEEISELFAAFVKAFPDKNARVIHTRAIVKEYAKTGEIHTVFENGCFTAAALWSLPYQKVPSPVFDFDYTEPCCKLYLIVSRDRGMGDALMHFALFRYAAPPLLSVCAELWQEDFLSRYGFKAVGKTAFGTVMLNDRKIALKKDCEK